MDQVQNQTDQLVVWLKVIHLDLVALSNTCMIAGVVIVAELAIIAAILVSLRRRR